MSNKLCQTNWTCTDKKKKKTFNLSVISYTKISSKHHELECKMYNYKTFRKKSERKSLGSRSNQKDYRLNTQSTIHKRKIHKLDFTKSKIFVLKGPC